MKDARQTFEAIARANGGTDFSLKQDGRYAVQNIQSRWTYFRLGWEAATKREQSAQQQEPVARSKAYDMIDRFLQNNLNSDDDYAEYSKALDSIYTTPPASKPLTDEEISRIWMLNGGGLAANRYHDFARAIEAKLREKNA